MVLDKVRRMRGGQLLYTLHAVTAMGKMCKKQDDKVACGRRPFG